MPSENRKYSLINVYSGDIIVAEMPSTLALGLFIELIPQDLDPLDATINIFYGKKHVGKIKADVRPTTKGEVGAIPIPLFMLPVDVDANIKVVASAEGYQDQTILDKKIYLQQAI
ncbi:hypothetical protein [Methylobacterium sp. yr668]|uniref:hypothetical protein n=1 Tax=Methylobacterium sp. yr668 TaxID=1761801 RepID=UPI001114D9CA|nr:hypothetical protein [Methylobacterium sp. yr668]